MRITAPDVRNELVINDPVSGSMITLYYDLPTTQERIKYNQSLFRREGKKFVSTATETQQFWGKKKLTGFKEGDFAMMKGKKTVPYSSDPESKGYREDWKDLVCTYASDLVEFLAQTIFGGVTRGVDFESLLEAGKEEETPSPPEDEVVEKN